MNMTKEKPERLLSDVVEYFGTQESCRLLRVDGPTLSKMKSAPDDRNMENGNHRYNLFEKLTWIGNALRLEMLNADQEGDDDRFERAQNLNWQCAYFCAEIFGCKFIPNDKMSLIKNILKDLGIVLVLLSITGVMP